MPLSDIKVKASKARTRSYKVADGGGLYLLVTPAGSRYWRMKYRFQRKEKLLSFGVYPEIGLADARSQAFEAKKLLANGIDPSVNRKLSRLAAEKMAAVTFSVIGEELIAKRQGDGRATETMKKMAWLLRDLAFPALGSRPITEITAAEILAVLRPIEGDGRRETARRLRSVIGQVFRYAIASARAESDPTSHLRGALAAPQVKHRAAILDPEGVGDLLRAIDGLTGQPSNRIALQIAPHVALRPGELRLAEWSELDLDKGVWVIPATRTKMRREHRVPITPQVAALLRELKEVTGKGRYLFPSVRTVRRPISDGTLIAALRRLGYSGEEMTAHGFRAVFDTLTSKSGLWSTDAIERTLAHQEQNSVRRAYSRGEHWAERVRLMKWWSNYLDGLRAQSPKKARAA